MNKLAQIQIAPEGGFRGFGPLGLENNEDSVFVFSKFISSAIGLITIIAIIWFIFIILTGAIGIMSAGGDKAALENARKRITNGVIGLVVVISGLFVLSLIGSIFGIPWILNVGELVTKILPN